ncbi:MAG TPA: hypothetical protein VGG67_09300 [Steroidobacteraceae bacterium]
MFAEKARATVVKPPGGRVRVRVRYACTSACAGVILFGSVASRAQISAAPTPNRTVNLNYVYAAELGFGGYSLNGLTARAYELPLSYTLHDVLRDGWALRILAPIQLGLYSLKVTDTNGERISIDQQSVAVVPGAELEIPVGNRTVFKPFGQFGVGHTFGVDAGSPNYYVFLAGARAVSQWHAGATTISLGNAVIYAGDTPIGSGFSEHYVSLQLGVELRHPLGFKVGTLAPDLGVYSIYYYYPVPLVFSRFLEPELKITNQGEIGFSIGSATQFQLLGLSNPRIGAGFIFGGGLTVLHINFGFQF